MFVLGIVPAILLILLLLLLFVFTAPVFDVFGDWFVVMIALAVLGVIGLWSAMFQDTEERVLPVGVTLALLFCGLLGAGPILIEMILMALEGSSTFGGWRLLLLLVGPVGCATYVVLEQILFRVSRASNKRLQATRETRAPEA
jgi:hypothetical protein